MKPPQGRTQRQGRVRRSPFVRNPLRHRCQSHQATKQSEPRPGFNLYETKRQETQARPHSCEESKTCTVYQDQALVGALLDVTRSVPAWTSVDKRGRRHTEGKTDGGATLMFMPQLHRGCARVCLCPGVSDARRCPPYYVRRTRGIVLWQPTIRVAMR